MKREQLVHTAKDLFYKYGIKRVTVEEICQEAGVSKMTFYKHFKNKHDLVITLIRKMTDEAMDKFHTIMKADIPFEEKVRETIQMKLEGTDRMSQEFLSDYLPHADPELHEFVKENARNTFETVTNYYKEAQKRGDIRQDIKIEFIIWYLNKMIDLLGNEELNKMYANPQEMIMELVNLFFYGILPRNRGGEDTR